jgi:hypothetical protein
MDEDDRVSAFALAIELDLHIIDRDTHGAEVTAATRAVKTSAGDVGRTAREDAWDFSMGKSRS